MSKHKNSNHINSYSFDSGNKEPVSSSLSHIREEEDFETTYSKGSGLNSTPAIGSLGGPVMYARTLRPDNVEQFLSGQSKLTNSMEELMLSNDDDVIVVLKRESTVSPDKWASEGIGPNSLKELQDRGFDIDHVYHNTINGKKVVWTLKANIDGTYIIVDRGESSRGPLGRDAGKNALEMGFLMQRGRSIKFLI